MCTRCSDWVGIVDWRSGIPVGQHGGDTYLPSMRLVVLLYPLHYPSKLCYKHYASGYYFCVLRQAMFDRTQGSTNQLRFIEFFFFLDGLTTDIRKEAWPYLFNIIPPHASPRWVHMWTFLLY